MDHSRFTTSTLLIEHLVYPPPPPTPPKFCKTIVSNFSWVLNHPKRNGRQCLSKIFEGKQGVLKAMWKSWSPLNKRTDSRLGLTKHSDLYEMIIVHPSLDLFSLCVLSGVECRKSLQDLQFSHWPSTTHLLRFRVLLRVNNPSNKCFITRHITNLFRPTLHLFDSCAWTLLY